MSPREGQEVLTGKAIVSDFVAVPGGVLKGSAARDVTHPAQAPAVTGCVETAGPASGSGALSTALPEPETLESVLGPVGGANE